VSHSITVLGAPGSGKSDFARKALKYEGSGIVVLAPGLSEATSYRQFEGNENYIIKGFDDVEFFPSAGSLKSNGYDDLLKFLRSEYVRVKALPVDARPKVLVTDTFSAISDLAINKTMDKFKRDSAPPAMSPDGASYWTHQAMLLNQVTRICRAIRGEGLHWISLCHTAEREQKETAGANPENISTTKVTGMMPAIAGGFRDVYAREFDLVLHAGVKKVAPAGTPPVPQPPIHYLQWRPDPKRPTKSRYSGLAQTGAFPNDYKGLLKRIADADAAERLAESA
jgi:hypothetical protein